MSIHTRQRPSRSLSSYSYRADEVGGDTTLDELSMRSAVRSSMRRSISGPSHNRAPTATARSNMERLMTGGSDSRRPSASSSSVDEANRARRESLRMGSQHQSNKRRSSLKNHSFHRRERRRSFSDDSVESSTVAKEDETWAIFRDALQQLS